MLSWRKINETALGDAFPIPGARWEFTQTYGSGDFTSSEPKGHFLY